MNGRGMGKSIKSWLGRLLNPEEAKRKDKKEQKQLTDLDGLSKLYDQEHEVLVQTLQVQTSLIHGQEEAIRESTLRIKQLLAQASGLDVVDFSIAADDEQPPFENNEEIQTDDGRGLDLKRLDEASDRIKTAIKESEAYQEELKEHAYQLEGGEVYNGKY